MSWKQTITAVDMCSLRILISIMIINILLDDGNNASVCMFTVKNLSKLPLTLVDKLYL